MNASGTARPMSCGGRGAVERHRRGRRHDRDRERDRLPEAQLAPQPAGLLGVARLALRSHRLHLRSLGAAPTQRRWRRKPPAAPRAAGRGRRPATTTSSPSGSAAARRSASARNFASRSPATTRDRHRELAAAAPTAAPSRRCPARAATAASARGSLRSRSARAACGDLGRLAGEQRLRRPAVGERLDRRRLDRSRRAPRRRRGAPRARPRRRCPRSSPTSTSRSTRSGAAQRDVQRDPPAHRVAAEGEALGRGGEHVGDAGGEAHRPRVARGAVAAQVGRQRPIAFATSRATTAIPARAASG